MLTATYTLVALSVEQASVRLSLQSFQHYVRNTLLQQNSITLSQLEFACESLHKLYQACHWRKTEMYLIPALRQTTERADHLLDELNRLNQLALTAIRSLQEKMGIFAGLQDFHVEQVCDSIETFCSSMLKRLEKEELELFAIARAAFAGDTWFSIANQMMMHDKHLQEMRRCSPAAMATHAAARKLADTPVSIPGLQVLPGIENRDEKEQSLRQQTMQNQSLQEQSLQEQSPQPRPVRPQLLARHGLPDHAGVQQTNAPQANPQQAVSQQAVAK